MQAHIATLKEQLATAEARIEKLTAELTARDASHADDRAKADKTLAELVAQLAAEKANTEKAIQAFSALADRLDALAAAAQRRPWWKRIAG